MEAAVSLVEESKKVAEPKDINDDVSDARPSKGPQKARLLPSMADSKPDHCLTGCSLREPEGSSLINNKEEDRKECELLDRNLRERALAKRKREQFRKMEQRCEQEGYEPDHDEICDPCQGTPPNGCW